jgi:hypothetical protein
MAMTAAAARIDALDGMFDDHPSLSASLSDFEPGAGSEARRSPQFQYPSIHSGFKSEYAPSEPVDSDSAGGYSPPAWRRPGGTNAGWWQQERRLARGSPFGRSREESPAYESADEGDYARIAANIRLPTDSPLKRSPSPDAFPKEEEFENTFGPEIEREEGGKETTGEQSQGNGNNCACEMKVLYQASG